MEIKDVNRPALFCPVCRLDAPHTILGRRGGTYALCCTHCNNGSLVCEAELHLCQMRWEDELRKIIAGLEQSHP